MSYVLKFISKFSFICLETEDARIFRVAYFYYIMGPRNKYKCSDLIRASKALDFSCNSFFWFLLNIIINIVCTHNCNPIVPQNKLRKCSDCHFYLKCSFF